jgi:hemolysin III
MSIGHPVYRRGEQIADRCVHYAGLAASPVGAVVLVAAAAHRDNALVIVSVAIYAVGLLAMISSSALYNLAAPSRLKEWLRRVDHAAIFLMIAGTYTPFALVRIGGADGINLLLVVWFIAVGGIALKLLYPRRLEGLSTVLYVVLGWTILAMPGPLLAAVPRPIVVLLGVGGLLYSAGVVFHLSTQLPYHNAIWHGFVLAAAACHYVAVFDGVALAGISP